MKVIYYFFIKVFIFYVFVPANAQFMGQNDSTANIEEVIVQGYPEKLPFVQSPISVGFLEKRQLDNYPSFSLMPSLNSVAGIRMEERSPGSYRLSVRGSLLRSPFGVRNIKMYLDEFPLTDASGNSYFNLLDAGSITRIDILKGPQGSLFGANTGGIVRIDPFGETKDSLRISASITGGSFGLFYQKAEVERKRGKNRWKLYQSYQRSDGYREHSALQRHYFQALDEWDYHKNFKMKLFLFYSDLKYQTPGGLTLAQYKSDPRLSRPGSGTVPSAMQQNTRVQNKTVYGGISHETKLTQRLKHVLVFFGTHTDFANPFLTNYEQRNETSLGVRTYVEWGNATLPARIKWKWHNGIEWQKTFSFIGNYGNKRGIRDTVQAKDRVDARQYFLFSQFTGQLGRLTLELGVSWNHFSYHYRSLLLIPIPDFTTRSFQPQWMPRAASSFKIIKRLYARASASKGYSSPTIAEVRASDNVINTQLQAETGWNYEGGLRYQDARFMGDVALFNYSLQNAIVRRLNSNGTEYFINAGSTKQSGLEWQGSALLLKPRNKGFLRELRMQNSFTYYQFTFSDYKNAQNDYSGNKLTGVPQKVVVSSAYIGFVEEFYLFMQHNYTTQIPLNDQNSEFASDYHLLQAKLGWKLRWTEKRILDLFAGVDNILNEKYSLGNDLNAIGGRYYNAAPSRNFYAGVGFQF